MNRTSRLVRTGLMVSALMGSACAADRSPVAPSATMSATDMSTPPAPAPAPSPTPTPAPAPTPAPPAPATARYVVVFDSPWSAATHPVDFPATSHFSKLVGGTHNSSAVFWREGELASQGIKQMAESGRTSPLDSEIAAAIASGTAERVFTGEGMDRTPGSLSLQFEISQRYPLVTLVSMVAPSPDWFVGVSGLSLFEGGQWVDQKRIDLVPWDAGTDSGTTFMSPDLATRPPVPISRILTAPLSPGGVVTPLGTFTFMRMTN